MKQLVCEMCGGADFIKQESVFVCQNCGIKYSLEEAKKMMTMSSAESIGIVEIDNSKRINNLLQLARNCRREEDYENAAKYYELALQENPLDWEAKFYLICCQARCCRIMDVGTVSSKIIKSFEGVFELVKKENPDIEIQKKIVVEIANEVLRLANFLFTATWNTVKSLDMVVVNQYISEWFERYYGATQIYYGIGDIISEKYIDDDEMNRLSILAWKKGIETHQNFINGFGSEISVKLVNAYKSQIATLENMLKKREEKRKKVRYEAYWAEHVEEKTRLELELKKTETELGVVREQLGEISAKKDAIEKKKNAPVPADDELQALYEKKNNLLAERKHLGIFASKRKKAIMQEVQIVDSEIEKQLAIAQQQRNEIVAEVEAELMPMREKIQALKRRKDCLNNQKKEIERELTKER